MITRIRPSARLRHRLGEGVLVAAGCFDPLSARLAEMAGFEAIHLSGFGTEISQLAAPDLGLITLSELAAHAARMSAAVSIPILADIDTGFGGVLNVHRTIVEMERAGVAGVHIEDQALPKRCPLLAGRRVVDREDAVARVAAACDARADPDFVIVARTDADVVSYDEVVARCNLYLETGADMVMPMVSALRVDGCIYTDLQPDQKMGLLAKLCQDVDGPLMGTGSAPPSGYTTADLGDLGYSFLMFATSALGAAANAMADMYADILEYGTDELYVEAHPGKYNDPNQLMEAVNMAAYLELEKGR